MATANHLGSDLSVSSRRLPRPVAVQSVQVHANVADLVAETARLSPESIALSLGADTMTFRELAAQSARLATYLISLGARPDVPIALCLERSFDFIVSALAALTSGAAYLPLDPAWPAARLQTILEDAQAPLVISRGSLTRRATANGTRSIDLRGVRCD